MSERATWEAVWARTQGVTTDALRREVEIEAASSRCREILGYLRAQGLGIAGLRVVEIGCGSAIYGSILAQHGASVLIIDQSAAALARAMERAQALGLVLEPVEADAFQFARGMRGPFELAMSFGTVEHFRPPLRFELCKVHADLVRPGGVVVISVPNRLFLPHELLKHLLIWRKKWFLGYEGSFTPWELRAVARSLGLREIVFHGTDCLRDVHRYRKIVTGTRLWRRVFPLGRSDRTESVSATPELASIGPTRRLVNGLLGLDITLLGVKAA